MKLLVLACAAALAAAATTPKPTKPPAKEECRCALGLAHHDHVQEVLEMKGGWDKGCDPAAERLCMEECHTRKDQLELDGGWAAPIDKDGDTVGTIACKKLGRDEERGLHTSTLFAVCGHDLHGDGPGLREPLCCKDGAPVKCQH